MIKFELEFDQAAINDIARFALIACQDCNYGDKGYWHSTFLDGLGGMTARLFGVARHYREVHAWVDSIRSYQEFEYQISSIFFGMDSALECLVFSLNALGNAFSPGLFQDITSGNALQKVRLENVLGKKPLAGYDAFFPRFKRYWDIHRDLITIITNQHDVSKHRKVLLVGGSRRNDPPAGYFKKLGLENEPVGQVLVSPSSRILIDIQAKKAFNERSSQPDLSTTLELVANAYQNFLNDSFKVILEDLKSTVRLNYQDIQGFPFRLI